MEDYMAFKFWEFFLAIESDLTKTTRFVEFNEDNFKTYSIEFARILLSASSEVAVLFTELCSKIPPKKSRKTMNMEYFQKTITEEYPKFHTFEVSIPRYGIDRKPWKEWYPGSNINLSWWDSYNNVKHDRANNFEEANLENAIDSVAGLFSLVVFLRKVEKDENWFSPLPQIFDLNHGRIASGGGMCDWVLDDFS